MLGRSRFCDIRLQEDTVSRLHAAFLLAGDGVVLEDLGSSNGTFVNGEPVVGARPVVAGDVVRFGATRVGLHATVGIDFAEHVHAAARLRRVAAFGAQNAEFRARFESLGVAVDRITVSRSPAPK